MCQPLGKKIDRHRKTNTIIDNSSETRNIMASQSTPLNFAKAARAGLSEEEIEKMNANMPVVAIIEIHQDATNDNQEPNPRQDNRKTHSNQVKPEATELAHQMFRLGRQSIVSTKSRSELEQIFRDMFPHERNVSFAEVLFAMAKGLKLVNVFNGGKDLEWHIGKYQPPKKDTRVKNFQSGDGWTMKAKVAPVADRPQLAPISKSSEPIKQIDPIEALKFATQDLKETDEFVDEYRQKHQELADKIAGMVCQYESGVKNKRVLERVLDFEDAVFKMTASLLDDLWAARQSFYDEKEHLKTKI